MRPRADQHRALEQLRRQLPRERLDLACELALNGQCVDAPGESAEREQRPAQLWVLTASRTHRDESAQELRAGQRAELSAERLGRGHEQAA